VLLSGIALIGEIAPARSPAFARTLVLERDWDGGGSYVIRREGSYFLAAKNDALQQLV